MKQLYFLLLICLLTAHAGRATSLVAAEDTVPGHARAVRLISGTLCTKITREDQRSSLANLSPAEGKTLLTQLVVESMGEHMEMLTPMLSGAKNSRAVGESLGRDVVLNLARECPSAQQLVMRMGVAEMNQKDKPAVSEKEKAVLSVITTDICQRLDKQNAEQPLDKMSKEERQALMASTMQGAMLAHMEELTNTYGLKTMRKKAEAEIIGRKIGLMMAEQCSSYLLLMGMDSLK